MLFYKLITISKKGEQSVVAQVVVIAQVVVVLGGPKALALVWDCKFLR